MEKWISLFPVSPEISIKRRLSGSQHYRHRNARSLPREPNVRFLNPSSISGACLNPTSRQFPAVAIDHSQRVKTATAAHGLAEQRPDFNTG